MRNSFRSKKYFKKKQNKLGYLPVRSVLEGDEFKAPPPTTASSLSPNLSLESRDLHSSFLSSLQPRVVHQAASSLITTSLDGSLTAGQEGGSRANEDEHDLIAMYCRELARAEGRADSSDEVGHSEGELESGSQEEIVKKIQQLEEENQKLTKEHEGTYYYCR